MAENVTQIKNGIMVSVIVNVKILKSITHPKKIWNPATCSFKNVKYLESIIDDSVISCYENMYTTKTVPTNTVPTNFNEKR